MGSNRGVRVQELALLVSRARVGDAEAFKPIVRGFQDLAVGYAYVLLGDFQLAEDAAQEAFLTAWRELVRLKDAAAFPGWFRKIVFTHCQRLTRGKKLPLEHIEDVAELRAHTPAPDALAVKRETRDLVWRSIAGLPAHAQGPHPYWGGEPHALHVAAEWGRQEVVALLLGQGADPNAESTAYDDWAPLHLAVHGDHGQAAHQEVAEMLIAHGPGGVG